MASKTVAIVQARCRSARLPRKVFAPILGRPMLSWVVNRLAAARLIEKVVVATSDRPEDDEIERLCSAEGWSSFRGSENDVLDRYYGAATAHGADVVVRITGDCPLIDPAVTDLVVATYFAQAPAVDYASNCQRRSYPRGLDTEVFSFETLRRVWTEDRNPAWREHVTPYIYRSAAGFRLADVVNAEDHSASRWTVDTPEDLTLVRDIYSHFGSGEFGWGDVLAAERAHPEWSGRNRYVHQKEIPSS